MYKISLTHQAEKDAGKIKQAGLKPKAAALLVVIRKNPFQNPPPYEKLKGYNDTYSRRINIQHRLVYQVISNDSNEFDETGTPYQGKIKVIRMWTHYE